VPNLGEYLHSQGSRALRWTNDSLRHRGVPVSVIAESRKIRINENTPSPETLRRQKDAPLFRGRRVSQRQLSNKWKFRVDSAMRHPGKKMLPFFVVAESHTGNFQISRNQSGLCDGRTIAPLTRRPTEILTDFHNSLIY
jgi:hypothetical protein